MARTLGRYELLRPLARGGMAEVYLARRRAAGVEKWLVVKRIRPERSGDARFLDLFVREARLSMSLVHQNIVPVFDFGRIDDQVFLAMERVEGRDLGSSLARASSHRLPPLLAAFVAAECCQALDYAHQRKGPDGVALGIVHRDVTPRNVLLSWSGEVKLTDFGIAALAGDATSRLLGTPQYMAPEQARSEPIDPRADLYAIGLVLREAINGVRPRPGTDRDSMLDAARRGVLLPWSHLPAAPPDDTELALGSGDHGEPPPPPEAPPPALVAIVDRATAISAADRFPDARSMLEELDAFIVAERAARKDESPARQLAAWLAGVWDGAGDDAETDAAIEADALVSFLDDGAFDLVGTGTVRSLAATAADDGDTATKASMVPLPSGPLPGASAKAPIAPASADRTDRVPRSSRISSSISTVASGSFHTLPAPNDVGGASPAPSKRRWIAPLAGIALVAAASGAALLWIASRPHDQNPGSVRPPSAGPPPAHIATGPSDLARPSTAQPGTALPGTALPGTAQPSAKQASAAQPGVVQSGTGPPRTEQPRTAPPDSRHTIGSATERTVTEPRTDRALTAPKAGPGPAHTTTRSDPGPTDVGPASPGSGSATADVDNGSSSPDSNPSRPATCRVRINLTPWAYYTADDDGTRHETPGTIDLTPGPHRLHVWNPELHVERDIILHVPADRDTMNYSEPLQPTSLTPDAGRR